LEYVASAADGKRLWAAGNAGSIYTSTNSGTTWQSVNGPADFFYSVACSADGSKVVIGAYDLICVSTNSGETWTTNSVPGPGYWCRTVASSADGNRLLAVPGSDIVSQFGLGYIYVSADFGTTWVQADAPIEDWRCVASSADGGKLVGAAPAANYGYAGNYLGGIYTSQTTPAPCMNVTPANGSLTLSWTVPSTNFVLQQNPVLSATNWTAVTNPPVLNLTNLQDEVVLSPTNNHCFYRLRTP
jgi:hypothetical protein